MIDTEFKLSNLPVGAYYFLLNTSHDRINQIMKFKIKEASEAILNLLNLQLEEVINTNILDIIPEFPIRELSDYLDQSIDFGPIEIDFEFNDLFFKIVFYKLQSNNVFCLFQVKNDQQKRSSNLREFLIVYHKYFDNFPIPIFILDQKGNFLFANKKFCKTTGYKDEEVIGLKPIDIGIQLHPHLLDKQIKDVCGDHGNIKPIKIKNKKGFNVYLEFTSRTTIDQIVVYFFKDITKRSYKDLIDATILKFIDLSFDHNSEELMQLFLDELETLTESNIGFFHFISDDQNTVMLQTWSTNTLKNMCKAEGFDRHYPVSTGGVWVDCITLRRPIVHNDYPNLPNKKGLPKGHAPVIRELVVPIFRRNKVVALYGVGNKSTPYTKKDVRLLSRLADSAWETIQRKLTEEAIQTREKQYRNFIQLSRESIAIYDLRKPMSIFLPKEEQKSWLETNLILKECNELFLKLHGFHNPKEVLQKTLFDIYDSLTVERKLTALIEHNFFWQNLESRETLRNGTSRYTLTNVASIIEHDLLKSIWVTKIDISERKRMENEVSHLQKMESLGLIASGLAHDFNNILSSVLGNIDLLKLNPCIENNHDKILNNIEEAVTRGKDITKQLFNYTKDEQHDLKLESIDKIIDNSIKLGLVGSKSKCIVQIEDHLPKIEVDSGQIYQVITNLLINADQSMEMEGEILLDARKVVVETSINMRKGNYILLSIKDKGKGIPVELQDKIFTPFISTKKSGLGLGLANCMSIIKSHKGHIEYTTEIGEGTEFRVYIPYTEDSINEEEKIFEPKVLKSGRILVMDDDDSILSILKIFLEQLGQTVSTAASSSEAITLYKKSLEDGDKYDLVILDLILPGDISGAVTLKKLLVVDSSCKGIICTGSLNKEEFVEYDKFGFCDTFAKPFSFQKLRELLSKWIAK